MKDPLRLHGPAAERATIRVETIRDPQALAALVDPWRALARDAVDPNYFFEPGALLPALSHLSTGQDLVFVCVVGPDPDGTTGPQILYALFPFERRPRFRGFPCRTLQLFMPTYNRLSTPLVHREFVGEAVTALLDWLERGPERGAIVEFQNMNADARVAIELHQQIGDRRWTAFQSEYEARALLVPMADAETYLERALRGRRRKELRRQETRLGELGPTEYRELAVDGDPRPWIAAFLALEAKGWKGQEGTSLASSDASRRFFEAMVLDAHAQGQLMMLGLFHKNEPIALKCNFLCGRGSIAFKIAFDEAFSKYSPGMLLEIENVRRVHQRPAIAWMDSTAVTRHFMINRLWVDRRAIETLLAAPRGWRARLLVAGFPLFRFLKSAKPNQEKGPPPTP